MENFLVYIIFFVLLIIGLARRVQEARQEAERRKQTPSQQSEEVPERTRRVLYGEEEPPETPERSVRRPAQPRMEQQSREMGPERSIPRQREVMREDSGRWIPEQREVMRGEGQRAMPGETAASRRRQPAKQEGKATPEAVPKTEDLSLPGQTTVADTERQLREGIKARGVSRRKAASLFRFEELRDVRKGVVLREILGPPRGLRPFEDRQ